jgi:cystathionine beta-lyase/cystathionine gamma-synthase
MTSGMAAAITVFLAFLYRGSHLVGTDRWPVRTVVEKEPSRFEVEADFVDTSDIRNIERRLPIRP